MPTRTVTIYEVPNSYALSGTSGTVIGVYTLTINDDDSLLNATSGQDTGSAQVLTSSAGTISSYDFLYNDTIRFRPTTGGWRVTETIKTFQLTIDGQVHTFIMNDTGSSIPGMDVGTSISLQGYASYTPVNYSSLPCFAAGTMIRTDRGPKAVEDLVAGDLVWTLDHGHQPLRWVGHVRLTGRDLMAQPELAPVVIRKGMIDGRAPSADLTLSPQHRILLTGWRVVMQAGQEEALAPIGHLTEAPGIDRSRLAEGVTYYHILFDTHEIVESNGLLTESFLLGEQIRQGMNEAQMQEIFASLPELTEEIPLPCRPVLRSFESRAAFVPKARARAVERPSATRRRAA